jgi:hypothetical protein
MSVNDKRISLRHKSSCNNGKATPLCKPLAGAKHFGSTCQSRVNQTTKVGKSFRRTLVQFGEVCQKTDSDATLPRNSPLKRGLSQGLDASTHVFPVAKCECYSLFRSWFPSAFSFRFLHLCALDHCVGFMLQNLYRITCGLARTQG